MKKYFFYMVGVFYITTAYAVPQKNTPLPAPAKPNSSLKELERTEPVRSAAPSLIKAHTTEDLLHSFLQPIEFSRSGFNNFFSIVFNSSLYAERFLPSCFVHMIDFLDYGKKHDKSYAFYESVFTLFHQRLKESTWVNSYALLMLLDQLPAYIDPLTDQYNQKLSAAIKAELTISLNERSFLLKDREDQFYTEITQRIMNTIKTTNQDGSLTDVQKSVTTFLEGAMGKLIWSPHERDEIWKTIKLIAKKCEILQHFGCIASTDDLNRLIWSLLYRFGYFIECTGSQLPMEFYQNIREEMRKELPSFLAIEEHEEWLITKKTYLENTLAKAEIKALAQQQGILTDLNLGAITPAPKQ